MPCQSTTARGLIPGIAIGSLLLTGVLSAATAPDDRPATTASTQAASRATDESPLVISFERFHRHSPAVDGGVLLLAELNCTACHQGSNRPAPRGAPNLDGAGRRLQAAWVRQFLLRPHQQRPRTTMPDVLAALAPDERASAADALTAWLMTQQKDFPELVSTASTPVAVEFWNKGSIERGRQLYHQVGCVACHEPDPQFETSSHPETPLDNLLTQLEPEEIEALGLTDTIRPASSVPHSHLSSKYTRRGLTHFLLDPSAARPSGRMPGLKLKPEEAADLAAWLIARDNGEDQPDTDSATSPALTDELAVRGKLLFSELGCVHCHAPSNTVPLAPPLNALASRIVSGPKGCLAVSLSRTPRYPLDQAQQQALTHSLQTIASLPDNTPLDQLLAADTAAFTTGGTETSAAPDATVTFHMLQLNCLNCHTRQRRGGVTTDRRPYFEIESQIDIGDEGRFPPSLDHAGYKLTPEALKLVFAGKGDLRPYMLTRMPLFPTSQIKLLTETLPEADRPASAEHDGQTTKPSDSTVPTPADLAAAGRELLNGGCVQCHPVRGEQLPGVAGIDLAGITQRVRREWFNQFLLNPASLKERTRMPTFFPNGRSSNQTVLAGHVDQQIAAIWEYLRDVERQPLPEKIEQNRIHNFEIVPGHSPVVLRTFMESTGTHAIAVGFPNGVNYAFDAWSVRIGQMWKGRFLDAHGTWFDRFTPPARPLGTATVDFPAGPQWLPSPTLPEASDPAATPGIRFQGYRLDATGIPTLLYTMNGIIVTDRISSTSPPPQPPQPGRSNPATSANTNPKTDTEVRSLFRQITLARDEIHDEATTLWLRLPGGTVTKLPQAEQGGDNQFNLQLNTQSGMTIDIRFETDMNDLAPVASRGAVLVPVTITKQAVLELRYTW